MASHPNTISTPRLILRPFSTMLDPSTTTPTLQPRYLDFFCRMRSQPAVMQWSSSPIHASASQTEAWVLARVVRRWAYVVELKISSDTSSADASSSGTSSTSPIGSMAIRMPAENEKVTADFQVEYPELGFMLDETQHGHGYATEAVGALLRSFWAETKTETPGGIGLNVVEAYVQPANTGSLRVVAKCGFVFCKEDGKDHVYRVRRPGKGAKAEEAR